MSNRIYTGNYAPDYYDFNPGDLIFPGDGGFWWDFGDWSNMYQATNLTNPITAVGQGIASVRDKGPNGFHPTQAVGTERPQSFIQSGFKCADFNPANLSRMAAKVGCALQTSHTYIIFECDTAADHQRLLSTSTGATDTVGTSGLAISSGGSGAQFFMSAQGGTIQTQFNGSGVTPFGVYETETTPTLCRIWKDQVAGSQDTTLGGGLQQFSGGFIATGCQSQNNSYSAAGLLDGRIWQILHLGTIPSAFDQARVEAWFANYRY